MRGMVQLAAVAALAVLIQGSAIRADDNERKALLNKFRKMGNDFKRKLPKPKVKELKPKDDIRASDAPEAGTAAKVMDSKEVWEIVSKFEPDPVKVGGETVKARNMVKVWGELTDGKKVHLGKYKWKPNERFWVCFATARPVKVALYQDTGTKKILRLPDARFPASFNTVGVGEEYKVPVRMKMDNNTEDEVMIITVVAAGSTAEPAVNKDEDDDGYAAKDARDYRTEIDKVFRAALQEKKEWKATYKRARIRRGGDPDTSARDASGKVDDVAIIAVSDKWDGYITIQLQKQK